MSGLGYCRVYRIALVSREVAPFSSSVGRGAHVAATAAALAEENEVTIVTTALHRQHHAEMLKRGQLTLPQSVRFLFVEEPQPTAGELVSYFHRAHIWSAKVYAALINGFPGGALDLVEFPDVGAEGAVTVQAKRTLDPALARSTVVVRAYGSSELRDVLNGCVPTEDSVRTLYDLERYALKYADRFGWPGGDVLAAYRRFFGEAALATPARLAHTPTAPAAPRSVPDRCRFLYLGPLERRKGVLNLLRAVTALDRDDWTLTIAGADSPTAPFGVSMHQQLELMAADDPRIAFDDPGERLLDSHDVVVVPSLWDCWPAVATAAAAAGCRLLATPVGGLPELVEASGGWVAHGTSADHLEDAFRRALDEREPAEPLPRRDPSVVDQYRELLEAPPARPPRREPRPLVTAIVPYYRLERHVGETIASLFDQTHDPLEVIVVNDGSFRPEDEVLGELAESYPLTVLAQENSGLGAARNLGISQARGRYVFPLDADNVALPTFVERCVDVLEADSAVAYVSSWSRFVYDDAIPRSEWAEGYHPLTNDGVAVHDVNTAGDAAAVVRREVFDGGFRYSADAAASYEDWLFYRELARAGLYGHVIPARLLLYRVRETSMLRNVGLPRHERLLGEMTAFLREREVQWTAS